MNKTKRVTKLESRLSRADKSPLQKINSKKSIGKKNSRNAILVKEPQQNLIDVSRIAENTDSDNRLYAPEFEII